MRYLDDSSPAVVLFDENGCLMYSSPSLVEWTGFGREDIGCLDDWLTCMFPFGFDADLVARMIERVTAAGNESEPTQFVSEFATQSGHRRRGLFEIHRWQESHGAERLMISFQPKDSVTTEWGATESDGLSRGTLNGLLDQALDLLNDAAHCAIAFQAGKNGYDRSLDTLIKSVARARGILTGMKGLERSWLHSEPKRGKRMIPSRIMVPEVKIGA